MTTSSVKAVYEFLRERNAPFSVQLLVDNLQTKKVKKSQVERSLDALVSEGKVTRKEFGKTKIFFLAQKSLEKATPEDLASLKSKAADLKGKVESERTSVASMKKELAKLSSELTDDETKEKIRECESSSKSMREKIEKIKGNKGGSVSKESFTETKLKLQEYLVLWRKYKNIFNELWGTMLESMESVKESKLRDDVGIETDEGAGAKYSVFNDLVSKKRKISPM